MNGSLFYLVELVPTAIGFRERVLEAYGPYESGDEAAAVARDLGKMRRHKVQPRRGKVSETWRKDAMARFDAALEKMPSIRLYPPWDLKPVADHFARMHPNDDLIGYFPDANYAAIDRLVYEAPGRYLKKFYPELTGRRIDQLLAVFNAKSTLCFAQTPDDVENVYRIGPNSCLKDEKGDILLDDDSVYHKPRFFGGPDLAVAYLDRGGRITARVVVFPAHKQYGRAYGDTDRLCELLVRDGYSYARYFENARVNPQLMNPKGVESGCIPLYTLPYLDNIIGVILQDGIYRTMTIAEATDPAGSSVHQYSSLYKTENGYRIGKFCPLMERWMDDHDMITVTDLEGYDTPIRVSKMGWNLRTFECAKNHKRYRKVLERIYAVEGYDRVWSQEAFKQFGFSCGVSGRKVDRDHVTIVEAKDGRKMLAEYLVAYEDNCAKGNKNSSAHMTYMISTHEAMAQEALKNFVDIRSSMNVWDNHTIQYGIPSQVGDPITLADITQRIQEQIHRGVQIAPQGLWGPIEFPVRRERNRVVIDANRLRGYRSTRAAFEAIEGRPYPQNASSSRNPRTGDVTILYDE